MMFLGNIGNKIDSTCCKNCRPVPLNGAQVKSKLNHNFPTKCHHMCKGIKQINMFSKDEPRAPPLTNSISFAIRRFQKERIGASADYPSSCTGFRGKSVKQEHPNTRHRRRSPSLPRKLDPQYGEGTPNAL